MIPNCNEIFERATIMTQIYQQGLNPYTRENLSLEMVEKYNKEPRIAGKITDFKKGLTEFFAKQPLESGEQPLSNVEQPLAIIEKSVTKSVASSEKPVMKSKKSRKR